MTSEDQGFEAFENFDETLLVFLGQRVRADLALQMFERVSLEKVLRLLANSAGA